MQTYASGMNRGVARVNLMFHVKQRLALWVHIDVRSALPCCMNVSRETVSPANQSREYNTYEFM